VAALEWDDSRRAFGAAARWYVDTVRLVDGRWGEPGLGEWDVRALVGHASRSLITVETYLQQPADTIVVDSAAGYIQATREIAAGPAVAERGRAAGQALGDDPATSVAELADRVLRLVDGCDGTETLTTIVGGMVLAAYLPTRTFELAVHTTDLAAALDLPADVPADAAAQALALIADVAIGDGNAGRLLLALTGRPVPPGGLSVL